jgi:hypothetical protein
MAASGGDHGQNSQRGIPFSVTDVRINRNQLSIHRDIA